MICVDRVDTYYIHHTIWRVQLQLKHSFKPWASSLKLCSVETFPKPTLPMKRSTRFTHRFHSFPGKIMESYYWYLMQGFWAMIIELQEYHLAWSSHWFSMIYAKENHTGNFISIPNFFPTNLHQPPPISNPIVYGKASRSHLANWLPGLWGITTKRNEASDLSTSHTAPSSNEQSPPRVIQGLFSGEILQDNGSKFHLRCHLGSPERSFGQALWRCWKKKTSMILVQFLWPGKSCRFNRKWSEKNGSRQAASDDIHGCRRNQRRQCDSCLHLLVPQLSKWENGYMAT